MSSNWIRRKVTALVPDARDPAALTEYIQALVKKRTSYDSLVRKLDEFFGKHTARFVEDLLDYTDRHSGSEDESGRDRRRRGHRSRTRSRSRSRSRSREKRRDREHRKSEPTVTEPVPIVEHAPEDRNGYGGTRGGFRGGRGGGRGGYRGGRSSDYSESHGRPDPNLTTVYLQNVPKHQNSIMSLSGYFGRFGQIVNVQVLPDEDKAYVQFSTHESAAAAVSSPKAVFGNRFIKLVWAKFNPINKLALIDESKSEIATQELKAKFTPSIPDAEIEKKINELKEKTKAKQDIVNKLKDMKGVNPDRQKMIANLESEIATFGSQIAALESGDLPEELFNQESNADGRGRGGFRGRGRGAPAVRGRRPSATMKWDSRTKTVLVHGIPEHLAKEPILRSHFQTYGQILKVAMDIQGTGTALVEFDNRSNAQFAIKRGSKLLGADLNLVFYEQPEDSSQSDLNTSIQTEDFTAAQYPSEDEEDDDDRGDRSWKR